MGELLGRCSIVANAEDTYLRAVGDDDIGDTEDRIIPEYLIDDCLGEGDMRSFVLDHHKWGEMPVKDDGIAPLLQPPDLDGILISHQAHGIFHALHEKLHKDLPHTLFGCKGDILLSQGVEDCPSPGGVIGAFALFHQDKRYKFA